MEMARFKGKGAKNKGSRWGFYSDAQIREVRILLDQEPVEMCSCEQRRQFLPQTKITIVNCARFNMCRNSNETFSASYVEAHLLNGRTCFERNVNDSKLLERSHLIDTEADATLREVHDYKVDVTEDFPLHTREEEKVVLSADTNLNSVNEFNFCPKRLYSEVVSGMPEYFTVRKEVGEIDNSTTPVDKFGPGTVNINQKDTAFSLDEMVGLPQLRHNEINMKAEKISNFTNFTRLQRKVSC